MFGNLVEFQKAGLVTALVSIIILLLGAIITYYRSRNQIREMRLYPVLISASSDLLRALEPFTNESKRETFRTEIFFYLIEDSLKNFQKLISGEGIIALLNKKDKNQLLEIEYALHVFQIHIKEISIKWSIIHSKLLESATAEHLKERFSEELMQAIRKSEEEFKNNFFNEINRKFNESCRTPYSKTEVMLLELLTESAIKLKAIGCRGLRITCQTNLIVF